MARFSSSPTLRRRVCPNYHAFADERLQGEQLVDVFVDAVVFELAQAAEDLLELACVDVLLTQHVAQLAPLGGEAARLFAELTDIPGIELAPRPPAAPAAGAIAPLAIGVAATEPAVSALAILPAALSTLAVLPLLPLALLPLALLPLTLLALTLLALLSFATLLALATLLPLASLLALLTFLTLLAA